MTYLELKTLFTRTLKRSDMTATQLAQWISMALQRTQRLLNTPGGGVIVEYTVDDTWSSLTIPGDFLRLVSISVGDYELTRTNLQHVMLNEDQGVPLYFAQDQGQFRLAPGPAVGDVIRLNYIANFDSLSADDDTNYILEIAPDVILNAAMVSACRHFADPRGPEFEGAFQQGIEELNMMAMRDALTNAAIAPAYSFRFDDI